MTYLNETPEQKTNPQQKGPQRPPEPPRYNKALSMSIQEDLLCGLHRRFAYLSDTDSPDSYYKLANAACNVQKIYAAISHEAESTPPKSADIQDDRAQKIAEICKIANNLSPEDYDPAKLEHRAAQVAAEFTETFGRGRS